MRVATRAGMIMDTPGEHFLRLAKNGLPVSSSSTETNHNSPSLSNYRDKSRRKFLMDCSALAVAGLLPGNLFAISFSDEPASLDKISFADFQRHVGTKFLVR